jgi:hypothetical protein
LPLKSSHRYLRENIVFLKTWDTRSRWSQLAVQKVKPRTLPWQSGKWPGTERMDRDGFSQGLACCIGDAGMGIGIQRAVCLTFLNYRPGNIHR